MIPPETLSKNDLVKRKEPMDILTHFVGRIEGPCTIAVDALCGANKTTFIALPAISADRLWPASPGVGLPLSANDNKDPYYWYNL